MVSFQNLFGIFGRHFSDCIVIVFDASAMDDGNRAQRRLVANGNDFEMGSHGPSVTMPLCPRSQGIAEEAMARFNSRLISHLSSTDPSSQCFFGGANSHLIVRVDSGLFPARFDDNENQLLEIRDGLDGRCLSIRIPRQSSPAEMISHVEASTVQATAVPRSLLEYKANGMSVPLSTAIIIGLQDPNAATYHVLVDTKR